MLKRVATAAAALLLPLTVAAQVLAPATPASHPLVDELLTSTFQAAAVGETSTIPVWASPDGRLLALVSMNRVEGVPTLPRPPLMGNGADWRIIDATNLLSSGLRWHLAGRLSADASFYKAMPASECGVDGSICAGLGDSAEAQLAASLGLSWAPSDSSRFSYGLSWLRSQPGTSGGFGPFNATEGQVTSGFPSMGVPFRTDSASTVFARGHFLTPGGLQIDLGASHGTAQLLPLAGLGWNAGTLSTEQSALSFGIGQGSLRGTVIGRVIQSVGGMLPGRRWTLLDVGLSWRTPWQGELSLGTHSYLAPQAEIPKRDADVSSSRVPYVQYRQDL